jgi:hypothetical protein
MLDFKSKEFQWLVIINEQFRFLPVEEQLLITQDVEDIAEGLVVFI